MGSKIFPIYGCPSWPPERSHLKWPWETCSGEPPAGPQCQFVGVDPRRWGPCVEGDGTCAYSGFVATCVESDVPELYWCWWWYIYHSDTCVTEGEQAQHDFDLPRKVWFDYGMAGLDGVFMDAWVRESDDKVVMRFGNKESRSRIHILIDPKEFLP